MNQPALQQLKLRRLLRETRQAAGLTQAQAAAAIGVSISTLVRIESGQVRASIPDIRALLARYGAGDRLAQAEHLARATRGRGRSWPTRYRQVLSPSEITCFSLEPAARTIHYVDVRGIPALLQTAEYARQLADHQPAEGATRVRQRVAAYLHRQQLLTDPPMLNFYLDESAIHRGAGSPIMHRQWQHVLQVTQHPKVTIQILPFSVGLIPTTRSFTLLELELDQDNPPETLLFVEDHGGRLIREEQPADIQWRQETLKWAKTHAQPIEQATGRQSARPQPPPSWAIDVSSRY